MRYICLNNFGFEVIINIEKGKGRSQIPTPRDEVEVKIHFPGRDPTTVDTV